MGTITPESIVNDLRYLQLLSRSFPTIADASTEIINLEAILNLPKGTEHFLTDIHGEYEAFQHVLKNASGAVKRKVNEIFGHTLRESEKKEICTLIYYPEEKLQLIKEQETDLDDWYLITLNQLVKVCQNVSSKYTRSKVRKALPAEFSYIIQELLHEASVEPNKHAYINVIISTIISTKRADDFIIAMCKLIQRLTIDSLHIVGDIYDRGPGVPVRFPVAKELGATHCVNGSKEDVVKRCTEICGRDNLGLVVECSGANIALKQAIEMLRPNGEVVRVGMGFKPLEFSINDITSWNKSIIGHMAYDSTSWRNAIRLLASGQIKVQPMITHRLGLSEWEKGFELMAKKEAIKVIFTYDFDDED